MVVQEGDAEKLVRTGRGAVAGSEPDAARGVYGISVAAELVGTGVQNLRAYEARGLLEPERTEGGTRRYSANDLDRLRRIGELLDAGVNLAGIAMVMDLQDENTQLRAETEDQPRLKTTPVPASKSPKRTSSSSRSRSTRR
jgi:DNA-binding transcriptional MerR regulator